MKKSYAKPALIEYGAITAITLGFGGNGGDSGSLPQQCFTLTTVFNGSTIFQGCTTSSIITS